MMLARIFLENSICIRSNQMGRAFFYVCLCEREKKREKGEKAYGPGHIIPHKPL